MRLVRTIASLALAAAAALPARAGDEPSLPPGVEARVYGLDIRQEDVDARLVKRWGATDRGKAVLEQLVDDTCVDLEARRRGVSVTDEEVTAYVRHVDETIRKQTGNLRSIEDVYKEQRTTPAEFAQVAHEYLVRQKMAAEDLGSKPGEEVPEHRLKLWLSTIRRRLGVVTSGLPDGTLARIGEAASIDRARFGRALRERLGDADVKSARAELVLDAARRHAIAEAGIVVTDADVAAEMARVRARFADDPRVRGTGLTFDQFLRQTRGTTEEEFAKDPTFRDSIAMDRLLSRGITDADVRKRWEENRDAYGERALVRQIYVPAGDEGDKFHMRSFKEAFELALRAKAAVLEAAGRTGGAGAGKPLPDALTAVAKQFEQDAQQRSTAGEPVAWTRVVTAGEDELTRSVFEGEIGTLVGPVRSRVGYHLLVVEERRPAPAYDEVKDRVREDLLRKALAEFQIKLRADPQVLLAK